MTIVVGERTFDIEITEQHGKFHAVIDNEQVAIIPEFDKFGQISAINVNGKRYEVRLSKGKDDYKISVLKTPMTVSIEHTKTETEHHIEVHKKILVTSPMSGLVITLPVKVGQEIEKGNQLLILEAMKMQNEIKSPSKAKVFEIFVKVGQTVEKDDKLLTLEPV